MRTVYIEEKEKIFELIKSCRVCYVAMSEDNVPYVLPMNFALDGDAVILHSAQSGRMWETVKGNPKLCINWTVGEGLAWQDERVGCSYRMISSSALVEGTAEFIDDYDEKERCLHILMAQYSERNFRFNAPAVKNVGIIRVKIDNLTAKEFGVKVSARTKS